MDKIPHKRKKRPLTPQAMLLLAAVAVLLGGAAAWWSRRPGPAPETAPVQEARMLLNRAESEIAQIAIQPPHGAAYTLLASDEGPLLQGLEDQPLREAIVEEIWASAASVPAEYYILDTGETGREGPALADFGLQAPQARIIVTYRDGSGAELLIGDLSPEEEPQYYAALAGESKVYTVLQGYVEDFFHDAWYMRDFEQPQIKGAFLDRIQISGNLTLDITYAASGWQMLAPYAYPVSTQKTDALLQRIENMGFESCMGTPEENDLEALGLATPELTVTLTQAATMMSGQDEAGSPASYDLPAQAYTLLIGHETGRSGVYLQWEGKIYKASNFLLGFWKELTAEEFLLRNPVNLLTNQLERLTVEPPSGPARAYRVDLAESLLENGDFETDEYGNILYDVKVFREETEIEAQDFLTWYVRLSDLSPAGRLPEGYAAAGDCQGRILLENAELRREIAFYPYDALHLAMVVDGVSLFYVDGAACRSLLENCP